MNAAAKKLLRHSLGLINYNYKELSAEERELVTEAEFSSLKNEIAVKEPAIEMGDWVRFYSEGRLVIGEVRYITTRLTGSAWYATDAGEVTGEYILEVRKP